jgi:uncharacterized protein (TIGR04255 family)
MTRHRQGALLEDDYEDVPLSDAPLARVIGQLRFAPLSVLASGSDAAERFIAAISDDYPYAEHTMAQAIFFSPNEPAKPTEIGPVWQLRSSDRQSVAAVTNGALTLETTAYPGRKAFCDQLIKLVRCLTEATRVPMSFNRLGIRYTNRLTDSTDLDRLPELVQPQLLGLVSTATGAGVEVVHSLTQSLVNLGGGQKLLVQCGMIPADATIDPSLSPVSERSWILDVDSFNEYPDARAELGSDAEEISTAATACAERAYGLFRWAVTDAFLRRFGGQV